MQLDGGRCGHGTTSARTSVVLDGTIQPDPTIVMAGTTSATISAGMSMILDDRQHEIQFSFEHVTAYAGMSMILDKQAQLAIVELLFVTTSAGMSMTSTTRLRNVDPSISSVVATSAGMSVIPDSSCHPHNLCEDERGPRQAIVMPELLEDAGHNLCENERGSRLLATSQADADRATQPLRERAWFSTMSLPTGRRRSLGGITSARTSVVLDSNPHDSSSASSSAQPLRERVWFPTLSRSASTARQPLRERARLSTSARCCLPSTTSEGSGVDPDQAA